MAAALMRNKPSSTDDLSPEPDLPKRAAIYVVVLHAATGLVFGLVAGLWVWIELSHHRFFRTSEFNSSFAFIAIVGGITLVCTVLAGCLKERFWHDWRSPFRWPW